MYMENHDGAILGREKVWMAWPPNVYLQTYVLTYKRLDDVNNSGAYRQGQGHGHD